jgi:dTDP-4-dehydrorhamnose reductase
VTLSRVFVTGAAGQLGSQVARLFSDVEVVAPARASLDIADPAAVRDAIAAARPQLVVNCAAFNDVDGAEDAPLAALQVNAFAVRSLARAAAAAGAVLVHYSTDFVFDGTAEEPYTEDAAPRPCSTYAASKLLGEWFALEAPQAFVLRVESLFGTREGWGGRRGTLENLVAGLEAGREVRAFIDRIVSPSYIVDVAAATRYLVEAGCAPGLYHCVNEGAASWHEVALEAARLLGAAPRIRPVRTADVPMRAARPRYCALSPHKLAEAGFPMPPWEDALRRWLAGRRDAAA